MSTSSPAASPAALAFVNSEWLSEAMKPLAMPMVRSPMSAHVATVRALATVSACAA